jgi:hypothetical protein
MAGRPSWWCCPGRPGALSAVAPVCPGDASGMRAFVQKQEKSFTQGLSLSAGAAGVSRSALG